MTALAVRQAPPRPVRAAPEARREIQGMPADGRARLEELRARTREAHARTIEAFADLDAAIREGDRRYESLRRDLEAFDRRLAATRAQLRLQGFLA